MHKKLAVIVALAGIQGISLGSKVKSPAAADGSARIEKKLLWQDPTDIESRDLYYGAGRKEDMPQSGATFTFEKEDLNGTNPKYVVADANGTKWKVKLGDEAKPEPVASRIVWASGYFVDEDYFLPSIRVQNIPADVKRGRKLIGPDGEMNNVRLKLESKDRKKTGTWNWRGNPFMGTREYDGLRVMMALINNWDLKDANNGIIQTKDGLLYEVTDLGASFGSPRFDTDYAHDKGDLKPYKESKFIEKTSGDEVDFGIPGAPSLPIIFNPGQFAKRKDLTWIGKHIPRADARWMGELLSRLSAKQIEDAFRAGGYTPEEANEYTTVVQSRIAQLKAL